MDLKTLWERTNDAINTIIRRDESTENGKLLQPCIEGKPFKFDFKFSFVFLFLSNPTCISAFGLFIIVESNLGST
jgi:hypothetical protein